MYFAVIILFALWVGQCVAVESVDINHADAIQIAAVLDGIGEKKAQRLVAWRQAHGPFHNVVEVAQVPGIGQRLAERNQARLVFGSASMGGSAVSSSVSTVRAPNYVLTVPVGAYTPARP